MIILASVETKFKKASQVAEGKLELLKRNSLHPKYTSNNTFKKRSVIAVMRESKFKPQ